MIDDAGGLDAAKERYGEDASTLAAQGKWRQVRLLLKVTPKASRVAGFIILWALAMKAEGRDGYTISEYQRYYNENERKAYRDQAEFRDLWREFETPNELARANPPQLVRSRARCLSRLPSAVTVVAAYGAGSSGCRFVRDREPWLSKRQVAAHFGFSTRWVELRVEKACLRSSLAGIGGSESASARRGLERGAA